MAFQRKMYAQRWSISGYHGHRECAFRFFIERIERTGAGSSYPLERGDFIHKQVERYLRSEKGFTYPKLEDAIASMPPMKQDKPSMKRETILKRLKYFKPTFDRGRKEFKKKTLGALVESPFAFNADWVEQPITDDYRTTNWGPIWLSGKIDHEVFIEPTVLEITDWKTGQIRVEEVPKYIEQLELYALVEFLRFPFVEAVRPRLAYLDAGAFYGEDQEYERSDKLITKLKKRWSKAVAPMLADRTFKPTPNQWCGWCLYGQQRGDKRCKY